MNKKRNLFFVRIIMILGSFGMLFCSFAEVSADQPGRRKTLPIDVAGIKLRVELAITPEEHMRGLMYRDTLEDNRGMLFVFPEEKVLSFWMKDTRIPLSIAFMKTDGRIIQIESMEPYSLDSHISEEKVKYALEMNDGWFKMHKVKTGDTVKIPQTFDEKCGD